VLKGHIVVVAGLEIVCNIKFCREDRIVDNVGELNLTEERSVGRINGVLVSCSRCLNFFVSGSSDVISQAGRRRSTSSRGAVKDVKSTSRGEVFQEGSIFP